MDSVMGSPWDLVTEFIIRISGTSVFSKAHSRPIQNPNQNNLKFLEMVWNVNISKNFWIWKQCFTHISSPFKTCNLGILNGLEVRVKLVSKFNGFLKYSRFRPFQTTFNCFSMEFWMLPEWAFENTYVHSKNLVTLHDKISFSRIYQWWLIMFSN